MQEFQTQTGRYQRWLDFYKTIPENSRIADIPLPTSYSGVSMNEQFYKSQAQRIRKIAETADPFIKKRLLNLAARYEVRSDEPQAPHTMSSSTDTNPVLDD